MADFFRGAHNTDASNCNFTSVGQNQINNSFTIHNTFAEERNSLIADLKPVDRSSCCVSPCTKGTRQWVLEQIYSWLRDLEAPNILLLSGSPGVGKSTIAWTLASELQAEGLLGSTFFCKRDNITLSEPTTVWRTVAFDLARRDTHFADRVIENLKAGKVDPTRVDIGLHFESLVKDPVEWVWRKYIEVRGLIPDHSTTVYPVVILDALDECGSDSSQSTQRRIFLDTLAKWLHFPPMFKLVITSRDQGIPPAFRNACRHIILKTGDLVSTESNLDIRLFFEQRLAQIASRYPSLQSWPGELIIKQLTDRAAGLFIWAETVARFLDQGRGFPDEQLELVLAGNFHDEGNAIDKLFHQILYLSFRNSNAHVLHTFKKVMGAILLAKTPLSRHDLYHFLGQLKSSSIDFILDQVSSVISDWRGGRPIHINHLSFFEFMCDPNRCPETFFIHHRTHSQIMALACFRAMNAGLRFNICQIETSYLPNDALDLAPRIKQAIPSHLSYSSLFGADHLHDSVFDGEILREVKTFMSTQFLFWLEVLSLLKQAKSALRALLLIREWSSIYDEDVVAFSRDASKFVTAFMNVISHSVPHIYLSALPFAPTQSKVSQKFLPQFPQMMSIEAGRATDWPAIQNVLIHSTSRYPLCAAFSQDGKYIVSGTADGKVFVWDPDTGAIISGPFHKHQLRSVTFSQDGECVISCANDGTICIWEVSSGSLVFEREKPEGSDSESNCDCESSSDSSDTGSNYDCENSSDSNCKSASVAVTCSWDGKYVVSCSGGGIIDVYNVDTVAAVAVPMHTSCITSVSCSWDAKYIASISNHGKICVYDLEIEAVAFSASQATVGHTRLVLSPDGRRIILSPGLEMSPIQIWDTQTGAIYSGPFERTFSPAAPVAFSPDGQCFVSSSWQDRCSICVMDANTGAVVSGPFYGHKFIIVSVAFSPDGQRVISSSEDGTVRIWDAAVGAIFSSPDQGHNSIVSSVAFSQDSKYVVSTSFEETMCIWNAETGAISRSIECNLPHTSLAAFSEDSKYITSISWFGAITIWDVRFGTIVSSMSVPEAGFNSGHISQDGSHAAFLTNDPETIYIWNADTEPVIIASWPSPTPPLVISHDGKRIASKIYNGCICIRDTETTAIVSELGDSSMRFESIAFSWDGKLVLTGSPHSGVLIWHVETGSIISGPFERSGCTYQGNYDCVAFSPDSKHIVSSSSVHTICIWDVETGEMIFGPFHGHTQEIKSITFSGDGKRIVSGSRDATIRIWDVEAKEHAFPIKSDEFLTEFKDNSEMTEDGWILGPNSELLFWVPPLHQSVLWRPSNKVVIGQHSTKIDFSRFVHGTSWNRCASWA